MEREALEAMIREIICEKLASPVQAVRLPEIAVGEADRMDTGNPADQVYTHDLFSLADSPRLGAGIMEMRQTTFPWTLHYDEIDYVIAGELSIRTGSDTKTARAGELLLIPKGSSIEFSAPEYARFLYVTYPADWQNTGG